MSKTKELKWELCGETTLGTRTWRQKVAGGWLYRVSHGSRALGVTFVPDVEPL